MIGKKINNEGSPREMEPDGAPEESLEPGTQAQSEVGISFLDAIFECSALFIDGELGTVADWEGDNVWHLEAGDVEFLIDASEMPFIVALEDGSFNVRIEDRTHNIIPLFQRMPVPQRGESSRSHSYLFLRQEGGRITAVASLTLTPLDSASASPSIDQAFLTFKEAVTEWINTTRRGAEAWEESAEDLNIGDLALCDKDPDLHRILRQAGLHAKFNVVPSDKVCDYDRPIALWDGLRLDEPSIWCHDIVWDPPALHLPKETRVFVKDVPELTSGVSEELSSDLADYLSDKYGGTVETFDFRQEICKAQP